MKNPIIELQGLLGIAKRQEAVYWGRVIQVTDSTIVVQYGKGLVLRTSTTYTISIGDYVLIADNKIIGRVQLSEIDTVYIT